MMFKLQASLGGDFTRTMQTAERQMQSVQQEVRALAQSHSDISAYQKQQTAVDATQRKLEDLQKQYDNIQKEYEETGESSSALANKMIDKQRQIDTTNQKLEQQTQKLDEMESELREAGIDTEHLTEESARLEDEMDKLGEEMKDLGEEMNEGGKEGAKGFEALGSALVAAGVYEGLKKLAAAYAEVVSAAQAYADEVQTMSVQYGVAFEDMQTFRYAAELVDVSVETITGSMTKNVKSMGAYQQGTAKTVEAYEKLGVSVENADGSLRDSEDVFWEVIDALGQMTNETERDVTAQTILGRSAMQLNPLIAAGSQTIRAYAQEAQNAGYILSDSMIETLAKLDDAERIQKNNLDALKNTMASAFAPEITKIREVISSVTGEVTVYLQKHPALVKGVIAVTAELGAFLGIYSAYIAAKKIYTTVTKIEAVATLAAKVAQEGLNAAILANPYVLAAAAVVALTAAVVALTNQVSAEEREIMELTVASRAEYDAMQAKKVEYEEAVELYGENSDQANRLAGEVDALTASYEANKQSMDDYMSEFEQMNQAWNNSLDTNRDTFTQVETNEGQLLSLVGRLQQLADQTNRTTAEQEEMKVIISALNAELPDLALNYSDVANGMGDTGAAIKKMVEAEAVIKKNKAATEGWSDALATQYEAELKIEQATRDQATAQEELNAAQERYEQRWGNANGLLGGLAAYFSAEGVALREAQERYDGYTQTIEESQATWDQAEEDIRRYSTALTGSYEAANGSTEAEQKLNEAISETYSQVSDLVEKYQEAQQAAYDSISGQYQIWDEAADVSATSVDTITANLNKQNEYWTDYNTNLQALQGHTGTIEGLSDVIASFADGSEESVNAIAGMAQAAAESPEKLQSMVDAWKKVQQSHQTTSESLAELTTDFNGKLDQMSSDLASAIADMDMSSEAYTSGYNTIQGFINGAADLEESLVAKYRTIGERAISAMKGALEGAGGTTPGYASGTESAAPGYALVGEEGPELVKFKGGERVIPAERTAEILGGGVHVSVSPTITINGAANESTASLVADTIVEQVLNALDEAGVNASRRAYR